MMEKIFHHFFYYPKFIAKKGDNHMAKQEKKLVQEERKIIKDIKYYQIYKSVSIIDDSYYSSIEKNMEFN